MQVTDASVICIIYFFIAYLHSHFLPRVSSFTSLILLRTCSSVGYFPKAENDLVSVWEDESIAFSTLENDYFGGDNTSIAHYTKVTLWF